MIETDILIIGAGIAGLTSAIYLKRANANFIIVDASMPGGKLNNIAKIENYPGLKDISGLELSKSLQKQVKDLGIDIKYADVLSIEKNDKFIIKTDIGIFASEVVIVASGNKISTLGIPGEKELIGKGVSYCATCDGAFFKNKDVAVIGSNDFAIEEANYLVNICKHVFLVFTKNNNNENSRLLQGFLKNENAQVLSNLKVLKINGSDFVESIDFDNGSNLVVNGVFPVSNFKSSNSFLNGLDLKMNNGYLVTDSEMETNIKNLFAIGDVRDKKLRQLVTATSDGAIAALEAIKRIKK